MLALLFLTAAGVYLAVTVFAVVFGWRRGIKSGSYKRAVAYSMIGFLVVYLPMFWDHIPTVLAHRHYCAKDGGLTVYRDPQQWLAEHKDELGGLRVKAGGEPVDKIMPDNWNRSYLINKLISVDTKQEVFHEYGFVEVRRSAHRLVDISSQLTIATDVQYSVGKPFQSGGLKVWLNKRGCEERVLGNPKYFEIKNKLFLQEGVR